MVISVQLIFINGNERKGLDKIAFRTVLHTSNWASSQKVYFTFCEPCIVTQLCNEN
jgi:hypothetical protein